MKRSATPAELKALPQWVCWRYEQPYKPGGKPRKVPYDPRTGKMASVTNSADWTDFATATALCRKEKYSGVGFVLTADDPFAVIDLDHCRDGVTGKIEPWAQIIIERFNTRTEISPSGTANCPACEAGHSPVK